MSNKLRSAIVAIGSAGLLAAAGCSSDTPAAAPSIPSSVVAAASSLAEKAMSSVAETSAPETSAPETSESETTAAESTKADTTAAETSPAESSAPETSADAAPAGELDADTAAWFGAMCKINGALPGISESMEGHGPEAQGKLVAGFAEAEALVIGLATELDALPAPGIPLGAELDKTFPAALKSFGATIGKAREAVTKVDPASTEPLSKTVEPIVGEALGVMSEAAELTDKVDKDSQKLIEALPGCKGFFGG